MDFSNTQRIRELNDQFRSTGQGGKILITHGISELAEIDKQAVISRVQLFDDFTEDNDPHQEHDFGAFDFGGRKIFWKIDYYGLTMEQGSENPSDPSVTTRVLTIMLANEY